MAFAMNFIFELMS